MKSQSTSSRNPCPVCENVNGACRILQDNTVFCHGLVDAKKGEKANGYVCVKVATGHTATFKPNNSEEWSAELKRQWDERKASRQERAKEEEQERQQRTLPSEKRHELYSDILNQLTLDPATIADLRRRGFTQEEIQSSRFKSVKKWQKLDKEYDTRLPGIGRDGRELVVGAEGYLCPLRDFEGRIVGIQERLHNPQDNNRYRWLSTPNNATLQLYPEGENPLAVFHPPGGKPEAITIVEGVGCKPFFVSQRLNSLVIGAAGGQCLSSPKLLEKYILAAIDKYGQLPIKVIPDAGWALNGQVKQKLSDTLFKFEKKYNFEFGFAPQDIWKSTSTKIEALKLLGVVRIIEAGIFSSQDDWVQAIVNEYYNTPEWFNLIGIPKAKQVLNSDGSLKSLKHVKEMINRFLDYFGLKCEQSGKTRTSGRSYTITTSETLENYLPDIDECLSHRGKTILQEMREVSLKEVADKAEEARRQRQESEEQQSELNKRLLESQLTHTHSAVAMIPSLYIKPMESLPHTEVYNLPTTETESWDSPETITDVAQMLEACENSEMLALLRQCEVPADIFRLAARQLPHEKREQIRQWVVNQNIDSA